MGCNNNILSKRPGSRKYGSIQSETVTPVQAEAYQAVGVRSYRNCCIPNILYCGTHLDTHSNPTRRAAHKKPCHLAETTQTNARDHPALSSDQRDSSQCRHDPGRFELYRLRRSLAIYASSPATAASLFINSGW